MTPAKRFLLPVLALLLTFSLQAQEPNRNVRFGLPSPAKADPKQREDYLIQRPQTVHPWAALAGCRRSSSNTWPCMISLGGWQWLLGDGQD